MRRYAQTVGDKEPIFWGYHFVSGAMTQNMARSGRLDELSHGLCSSDEFPSIKKHMATFTAAGPRDASADGAERDAEAWRRTRTSAHFR